MLHDGFGDAGAGIVADTHGFLMRKHLAGYDLAGGKRGGNIDVALVAQRFGYVLAVDRAGRAGLDLGGYGLLGFSGSLRRSLRNKAQGCDAHGAGSSAFEKVAS